MADKSGGGWLDLVFFPLMLLWWSFVLTVFVAWNLFALVLWFGTFFAVKAFYDFRGWF